MKKILATLTLIAINSFGSGCDDLLREGDKYLQRIPLCDEMSAQNAAIANTYYTRYEICAKSTVKRDIEALNILDNKEDSKCTKKIKWAIFWY